MNCKPGDIAIIKFHPDMPPFYVGRSVDVIAIYGESESGTREFGLYWWVRPLGWTPQSDVVPKNGLICWPDGLLRPIAGLPVTEDQRDEVKA